jgi:SET domain-containing protein
MALSKNIRVALRPNGQKGLFAAADVAEGTVLLTYDGPIISRPTRLSIQIDDDRHIEGTDDSNSFLNHSCDANAYVDWNALCLRAKRPIARGEEVTCNYFTTDYELHESFFCSCGSPSCKREIRGFRYLSSEEQQQLSPWLPRFLLSKLEQQ